jgi:hypothetical protein
MASRACHLLTSVLPDPNEVMTGFRNERVVEVQILCISEAYEASLRFGTPALRVRRLGYAPDTGPRTAFTH